MKLHATLTICRARNGQLYARGASSDGDPKYYHVGTSTRSGALFLRPVNARVAEQLEMAFNDEIRKVAQASLFPVELEDNARSAAT